MLSPKNPLIINSNFKDKEKLALKKLSQNLRESVTPEKIGYFLVLWTIALMFPLTVTKSQLNHVLSIQSQNRDFWFTQIVVAFMPNDANHLSASTQSHIQLLQDIIELWKEDKLDD